MKYSRRSLLLLASAAPLGCAFETEELLPNSGIPPWHLWGSSQSLALEVTSAGILTATSNQLARIDYGRPENWQFLFFAQASGYTGGGGGFSLDVNFDVSIGLGRAAYTISGFEHYIIVNANQNQAFYSSEVIGPARFAGDTKDNIISALAAQSLNVVVRTNFNPAAPAKITLNIACGFAPSTHVRPEWYHGKMPGGEDHGT